MRHKNDGKTPAIRPVAGTEGGMTPVTKRIRNRLRIAVRARCRHDRHDLRHCSAAGRDIRHERCSGAAAATGGISVGRAPPSGGGRERNPDAEDFTQLELIMETERLYSAETPCSRAFPPRPALSATETGQKRARRADR